MLLRKISEALYVPGTESENRLYKVEHFETGQTLFQGTAVEVRAWGENTGWSVVAIVVDENDKEHIARHNKNKIIKVI